MKFYKVELFFKNGQKITIPPQTSFEEAKKKMNSILYNAKLYYTRNGVNYGFFGKVFTFEEDNGGLERAYIHEYMQTDTIIIKE